MSHRLVQSSPEHIALISAAQKRAAARRMAGEGFIYIAEIEGSAAIKIGFSLEPARRIAQLRYRARLLGYFRATLKKERELHRLLASHRHPDFEGREIYHRDALRAALGAA